MCTNGVNTAQLKGTIEQIDETVALCRKWTHKMYHLADNGDQTRTAEQLQNVQRMLDDVRATLVEVQEAVDADDVDSGVTVKLV